MFLTDGRVCGVRADLGSLWYLSVAAVRKLIYSVLFPNNNKLVAAYAIRYTIETLPVS